MREIFSRNILFWGEEKQALLERSSVAVFGLGGVGGYCAEMLARAGIGNLVLVDYDKVSKTNINRQITALNSTVGQLKTKLFFARLKDINPDLNIEIFSDFFRENITQKIFEEKKIDFIADAIDTLRSKISLIEHAYKNEIPIISSMGAGNRINPEKLYISDISDIQDKKAPFISSVLYQLKKRNITKNIAVVASTEKPFVLEKKTEAEKIETSSGEKIEFNKIIPASTPFVPSAAGILAAGYIIRKLLKL